MPAAVQQLLRKLIIDAWILTTGKFRVVVFYRAAGAGLQQLQLIHRNSKLLELGRRSVSQGDAGLCIVNTLTCCLNVGSLSTPSEVSMSPSWRDEDATS